MNTETLRLHETMTTCCNCGVGFLTLTNHSYADCIHNLKQTISDQETEINFLHKELHIRTMERDVLIQTNEWREE